MNDLISRSELLKAFNNKKVQITFDLPVEEVLGEDVDLDDFAMLVQDAIQAYKKMVIDTIKNQPTSYSVDKVIEELKDYRDKNKMVVRVDVENMDSIKDKIEELSKYAESQYNNAIDDFIHECDKCCGFYTGNNKNLTREDMLNIAERLKEGGDNEISGR